MFRISKDGIFVNFKAAKDNNLPLPTSEFLGKSLYEVLPTEVAQQTMDCVERALSTGNIQIFEYQLLVNNNLLNYEARIAVSAENEVMAIIRDITDRKRAEEDIRKALDKQQELSELKSRFVTMSSHEFRTPLTTILSSAELIEKYSKKLTEEKKVQHLHRIQSSVKHMTQLLNNVLLIGKAEAGKLEFRPAPIDLAQFCRGLVEELQLSSGNNHTIAFCSQGECTNACLDEKLLRYILSNLLSNAIKYSPAGGTVNFDLICQQGEAIFRVQDRGIGIPQADQAKLFDSFHRASNVGTISGTGLGLAIVKKSVDLHQGTITVHSEIGVGTTFTVTLPLNIQVYTT
jgi:signal transduction histidine kinase